MIEQQKINKLFGELCQLLNDIISFLEKNDPQKDGLEELRREATSLADTPPDFGGYDFNKLYRFVAKLVHPNFYFTDQNLSVQATELSTRLNDLIGHKGDLVKFVSELKSSGRKDIRPEKTGAQNNNQNPNTAQRQTTQSSTSGNDYTRARRSSSNTQDYSSQWRPTYNSPPPRQERTQQNAWGYHNEPEWQQPHGNILKTFQNVFITKNPETREQYDALKKMYEMRLGFYDHIITPLASFKSNRATAELEALEHKLSQELKYDSIIKQYNERKRQLEERCKKEANQCKMLFEQLNGIVGEQIAQEYYYAQIEYSNALSEVNNGSRHLESLYPNPNIQITYGGALGQMATFIGENYRFNCGRFYLNNPTYQRLLADYGNHVLTLNVTTQTLDNYIKNRREEYRKIEMKIRDKYERMLEEQNKKHETAGRSFQEANRKRARLYGQYQTFLATYRGTFEQEEPSMGRRYG